MPVTQIRGPQVLDKAIQRADLDDGLPSGPTGNAVVRKLIQGAGITLSSTGFDSGTGDVTISTAAGGGDVVGPSSSADSEIALFNSTTGKIIKRATGSGIATVVSGVLGTTANNSANWDTAFTDRNKWDGGATGLVAATGRTSLGLGDAVVYENASTAAQASTFGGDTYVVGSAITVPAGSLAAGGQYRCAFDMTKTAAGVTAFQVNIRIGTLGTISDTAVYTYTSPTAQTAAVDVGKFEVLLNIRTTGASATIIGGVTLWRITATAAGFLTSAVQVLATTPGSTTTFNSTTATKIGVSFNGGSLFQGTVQLVQAEYKQ